MIELNGQPYCLSFSVNAVCQMEQALGVSLYDLLQSSVRCVRALIWCGLLDTKDNLTLEQTGEQLDAHIKAGGSLLRLSEQLAGALEQAGFFH